MFPRVRGITTTSPWKGGLETIRSRAFELAAFAEIVLMNLAASG
jgi:hypothetical protein